MRNTGTNHSDEGLFAAMEQKLSRIDKRLEDMSSQITSPAKRIERRIQKSASNTPSSAQRNKKKSIYSSDMKSSSNNYRPFEITTLTKVPKELPEFFRRKLKSSTPKIQYVEPNDHEEVVKIAENMKESKVIQSNVCEYPDCDNPKFSNKHCSVHTDSNTKKDDDNEKKVILSGLESEKSEKITVTEDISSVDNNLEEEDGDLNEIKKRIEQSLSNLDQAEVE